MKPELPSSPTDTPSRDSLSGPHAQKLFTLSQDLLCVASLEGHFLHVNPSFSRLLGYSAEELCSRPFADFVHPEDRDITANEVVSLNQGETTLFFENRYVTKDGRVVRLSWRCTPVESEGLIYGSARDVTEAHLAQEALKAAHQDLQAQSEELQAQSEELQAQTEELQAQTEELQAQTEELQAQSETLALQSHTLEVLNRTLSDHNQLIEAEVGSRTEQLQRANQHLTELNMALEGARELKTRILDVAPTGIAFLDRDMVFRWANQAYQTPDYPHKDVPGKTIGVVHPRIAQQFEPIVRQVVASGVPFHREGMRFAYGAGEAQRFWDVSIVPARDEDGTVDGVLILSAEATDRVERERLQREQLQKLKEIDGLKDEFLAVISHECRTPIHAIMGFASALEDEVLGPLTVDQRRSVHRILEGADRLLALIDDLLDMSRIQAGKFLLDRGQVSPAALCEGVLAELAPLAEAKGHHLALQLSGQLPNLHADGRRLGQALSNLVGNAIKFTEAAGTITLSARQSEGHLLFEVQDQGPGISDSDQARLFQRFTQLDMSATRASGGTGLGLSIVKAIAEAHGGSAGVRSQSGQGATFCISIPLAPAGDAP